MGGGEQVLAVAVQLVMGIGLAASAGLRAFLPLLVVGVAGRLDVIPLSTKFAWLATTPALVVFGVAVLVELLADKVPVVDNALDTVQFAIKPIAGIVLVASVVTDLDPLTATVLAILLGATSSGAVHLVKAKTRVVSTVTTAGIGNPFLSIGEDLAALVGSVAAIVVPILLLVCLLGVGAWAGLRRRPQPRKFPEGKVIDHGVSGK